MNIAIIGARDAGYLIEQISKSSVDWHIICIGDNNVNSEKFLIHNVFVKKVDEVIKLYHEKVIDKIIIAVRKGYSRYCLLEQAKLAKIASEDILLLKPSPLTHNSPIMFDKKNEHYNQYWTNLREIEENEKVLIHHLETHVADGCNLNCRGCLHFSNLYRKDEFPDIDQTLEDIRHISKKCEIFQFRILGGEPLLNKGLPYFINEIRKILPNTDIAVISNGILIPKTDNELFTIMKENNVGFNLTLYPPTLKMKDVIYSTLKQYGVAYGSHETQTDEFEKYIRLTPEKKGEAFKKCISRGIITLRNSRLYKCPTGTYIDRYFEYFDTVNKTSLDIGTDIYDDNIDWKELIDKLTSKKGAHCEYCSELHEKYKWSNGKPESGDWIVE